MGADVYLLLGPEDKDAEEKADAIRKVAGVGEDDVKVLHALSQDDVDAAVMDLGSASLFSDKAFDILLEADRLAGREISRLASAVKSGRDGCTLILRSEKTRLPSEIENIVAKDRKFVFYEMFENRKVPYVMSFFAKKGYKVSEEVAAMFLSLTEHDRKSIDASAIMLVNSRRFADDDRPTITGEDVCKYLDFTRDDDSLQVFSHLAKRDLSSAMLSADAAFTATKSYSAVISGVAFYVRRAIAVIENGIASEGAWSVSVMGQKPQTIRFPSEKEFIRKFAANFSLVRAKRALVLLERGEVALRGVSSPFAQRAVVAKAFASATRP